MVVLGLSEEGYDRIDGFGQENDITFPLLMHNSSINPYGVPLDGNFAVEVVVDRQNRVHHAGVGQTAQNLLTIIQSVL